MVIDIFLYILSFDWNLMERDEDDNASSVGSMDERLTKKKKAANNNEDGLKAKKMLRDFSPTSDEELRKKLRYPDEGPSRWGGCGEDIQVINLAELDPETDKDEDYHKEEDDNGFINNEENEEEEDDNDEDDSLDASDYS